jgi:XTP/dITP diphosphohydrolase
MTTLLISTRNQHKAREIQQVLGGDFQYLTLNDFPDAPNAVEDGATFAANAAKKVLSLANWLPSNPGRARLSRALTSPADCSVPTPLREQSPPSTLHPPSSILSLHILADDSGLEVDALDGAPGIHSARFAALDTAAAEGNSPDHANNAKLLRLLKDIPPPRRTARFRCVLALLLLSLPEEPAPSLSGVERATRPSRLATRQPESSSSLAEVEQATRQPASSSSTIFFDGVCEGRIALQPAGIGGFGYDPLFIPDGFAQSFAELGDAVKNTLSHRARALQKLRDHLAQPPTNR